MSDDIPTRPHHALLEFSRETDRGVAIVGVSILDDSLKLSIQLRLRMPQTKKEWELSHQLFNPDRPLGTFSSRRTMAYFMEIIGPVTLADLATLGKIRNRFGHRVVGPNTRREIEHIGFDSHMIKDLVSSLKSHEMIRITDHSQYGIPVDSTGDTPRIRYMRTVIGIARGLDHDLVTLNRLPGRGEAVLP